MTADARFTPYSDYQPSGVEWLGDVPRHWEVKRGRFVMRINPRADRLRALDPASEVSLVPMEAVHEWGGLSLDSTCVIGDASSGLTEFEDGDVVVAKITPCFENGKGALATGLFNGAALGTTELHVLRANQHLDRRFLFYLTIGQPFRALGEAEMYGAGGQKRVPTDFAKDFPVAHPPLEEQRAIAAFLDAETAKIDTLIEKKQALIEKLKEQRTALISRTVTRGLPPDAARAAGLDPHPRLKPSGIEWLGGVPEHWEVKRGRFVMRINPRADRLRALDPASEVSLVPMEAVHEWGGLSLDSTCVIGDASSGLTEFEDGDVVVAKITPCFENGKGALATGLFNGAALGTTELHVLRANQHLDRRFLFYLTIGQPFRALGEAEMYGAGGQKRVPSDFAKDFPVAHPPPEEQRAIAAFLDSETAKIDTLIENVEAAIDRLREYRSALITAAVTGKIDVRQRAT